MLLDAFDIIIRYHEGFLKGLWVTLQLASIIWTVGLAGGTLIGLLAARQPTSYGRGLSVAGFILGGLPTLVLLFWLHYPLQAMLHVVIDPFFTAAFCFSMLNILAVAEIVRSAIGDFPKQYVQAAKVCGLSSKQTFWKIELPLILRQCLPALLLSQVGMLHLTLFASLISVEEIFRVAQRINASIYKPIEIYTALGMFFLLVCLPVNGFAYLLKKKYTRNISEQ